MFLQSEITALKQHVIHADFKKQQNLVNNELC